MADLMALGAARIWLRPDPLTSTLWPTCDAPRSLTVIPRRAHILDLAGGLPAVLARISTSTRQQIRQARRRVTKVEMDRKGRLLPFHYQLYLTSVRRWAHRQHEPFSLAVWRATRRDTLDKLQTMAHYLGDAMAVQVAFVDGRPAASNITILGQTAHDVRAAIDAEVAGPSRAGVLLQWNAIELAVAHGCARPHLGESGESAGISQFEQC